MSHARQLPLGKLSPDLLREAVLSHIGLPRPEVVQGPAPGIDFAAIRVGSFYLIMSADPVTGAEGALPWYAVNVAANDVATSGCPPRYLESVVLLPEDASRHLPGKLSAQVGSACRSLGMMVVGGHTEVTPGLQRPIIICTTLGFGRRFVTAAGAQPGDVILMTKTAAIEGTAILGEMTSRIVSLDLAVRRQAVNFRRHLSVVKDALTAFRGGGVHGMHDPTEGGLLGGLWEMAAAAHIGFEVDADRIPVHPVTRRLCATVQADPLKLISSGTLLIAASAAKASTVESGLRSAGIRCTRIGRFQRGRSRLLHRGRREWQVREPPVDELWRLRARELITLGRQRTE